MENLLTELAQIDTAALLLVRMYPSDYPVLSSWVNFLSSTYLAKGIISAILFWWLWFRPDAEQVRVRSQLLAVLFISIIAIAVGRLMARQLPFRNRPLLNPELQDPAGEDIARFVGEMSSFPSDHAVMYFALAVGFLLINRWVGLIALTHAAVVVALPRAMTGLHYPGDLVAGALVGATITLILFWPVTNLVRRISRALGTEDLSKRWPQYFYPGMFFVTLQFATMFDSAREFASRMLTLL